MSLSVSVADSLLAATVKAPGLFLDVLSALGGRSTAAATLLNAACTAATYHHERRAQLKTLWPKVLQTIVAMPDAPLGHERSHSSQEDMVTALIPDPSPLTWDPDLAATIEQAWDGWPAAVELADLVPRWLPQAVGVRFAVDALIGFLRASPIEQQLRLGLPWVRALIRPETGTASTGSFLIIEWLRALRASPYFDGEARAHYQVIVDALVNTGDGRARKLQQQDE